jgi:hypothetical protein
LVEGSEQKRPKTAGKRQSTEPLPFRADELGRVIAEKSSGKLVVSTLKAGHAITLEDAIRGGVTLDVARRVGEWLAAGGDWRTQRGPLGVSTLVSSLSEWVALSEAWDAAGRPPVAAQRNGATQMPRRNGYAPAQTHFESKDVTDELG